MRETIQRFMSIFEGLDRAYGTYKVTSSRSDGKRTGRAATIKADVTEFLWTKHLNGEESLGIVPINDRSECKFGAIDIDIYDLNPVDVVKKAESHNLKSFACLSKSGGVHLYFFTKDWIPAKVMQDKLTEISAALGYGGSEIFPKQSEILADRGDVGAWINMPYFGGDDTDRYCIDDNGNRISLEDFIHLVEVRRYTYGEFDELNLTGEVDDFLKDGPPCLQFLSTQGFPEGTRNDGLFNLGVYLRKAFPDDWKLRIEQYNVRYLDPPLTSIEVQGVIKSLNRKTYRYTCSRSPIAPYCNIGVCKNRKHGVGTEHSLPPVHSLTKFDSDPPLWFLDVDGGGRIELSTEELQNQKKFQKRCMEVLNKMPNKVKEDEWLSLLNSLLERVNIIEVPKEASAAGQLLQYVEKFCTRRAVARELDEILLNKAWKNPEDKRHYFRLTDLIDFLNRQHFREFKSNKITSILRQNGATHHFFRIKGLGRNLWSMPEYEVDEHDKIDRSSSESPI